jgi:hypothetical protein
VRRRVTRQQADTEGNMADLRTLVNELNAMVINGQGMEAFEKFYAETVEMAENHNAPTVGKDANRKREEEFFSKVEEWRKAEVVSVGVGDGVTFVEWDLAFRHKDYGDVVMPQVAVQRWEGDKIVHERFYHNAH